MHGWRKKFLPSEAGLRCALIDDERRIVRGAIVTHQEGRGQRWQERSAGGARIPNCHHTVATRTCMRDVGSTIIAEADGDPWSGHIACPGGRMDADDADLAATAIRETWEETGIDVARDGRVLGHLDDLSPRSKFLPSIVIRPYVGLVRGRADLVLSSEVASAFWVPIAALLTEEAWSVGLVSVRVGSRRVSLFQHGEHTVWGLTERALRQFLDYLGAPLTGESVDEEHL